MTGFSAVNTFCPEPQPDSSCAGLEEGRRRKKQSLPPLEDGSGRSAQAGNSNEHIKDTGSDPDGKWSPVEMGAVSPSSMNDAETTPESSACPPSQQDSLHQGGGHVELARRGIEAAERVDDRLLGGGSKECGADHERGISKKVDEGGGGQLEEGGDVSTDSAQRIFIAWLQVRQRECVILISLGCVTAIFIGHLKGGGSGTLGVAVAIIPVTVHVLLVRDIYARWDETRRQRKGFYRKPPDNKKETSPDHLPIQKEALVPAFGGTATESGANNTAGPNSAAGGGGTQATGDAWVAGAGYEMVASGKHKRGASGHSIGSSDSHSSSNRSSPGGISRLRELDSANDAVRDEDSWSSPGGKRGSDNVTVYMETPFQKSVRLLHSACEDVTDPAVRRQLKRVATLLADPDALHMVKEGSIRRVATDVGTRNYIENVLQTPTQGASAECNWRKLRTGMFVIRAMVKEAAAAEAAEREAIKNGGTPLPPRPVTPIVDREIRRSENVLGSELDQLLDDIAIGIQEASTQGDPPRDERLKLFRASSIGFDLRDWDADETATFNQLNRSLIYGQQQVAKKMSRGDIGKDLDRLSVLELLDLVGDSTTSEEIMEHAAEEGKSETGDVLAQMKSLPRLPLLDEERMEEVAALMADGRFLQWDFDVFALDECSGGHSLWYTAMSTFSHYNLIGAFGMSVDRLSQLFLCVESTYCFDPDNQNSYHTHVHAADVTLTVAHFLSVGVISNAVRSTHGVALLMAAIMHDYRHPGVNNGYLVRDLHPLAVTYNDASVLENFHAAEGFKMMLDKRFDIFKGWKPEDVKFFRHAYVKCILATDLALSMEYISKFKTLTKDLMAREDSSDPNTNPGGSSPSGIGGASVTDGNGNGKVKGSGKLCGIACESITNQTLLLQMVLKVADVAHPCKPWEIHRKWSDLITEEFFKQGDKEVVLGLAVSPLCDRRDKNLPKSQCDFIDFIVRPCVSIFSSYCEVSTWSDQLESNFRAWKTQYEEQGNISQASSVR